MPKSNEREKELEKKCAEGVSESCTILGQRIANRTHIKVSDSAGTNILLIVIIIAMVGAGLYIFGIIEILPEICVTIGYICFGIVAGIVVATILLRHRLK